MQHSYVVELNYAKDCESTHITFRHFVNKLKITKKSTYCILLFFFCDFYYVEHPSEQLARKDATISNDEIAKKSM